MRPRTGVAAFLTLAGAASTVRGESFTPLPALTVGNR
jgi:hypothetical protein